jgi:hypothetical protein
MKKLITVLLAAFSISINADIDLENPTLLLCAETTNPDYQYVIFMVSDDGWLYDAINTREARLKTYGTSPYVFQTLSQDYIDNTYFSQSWVHKANSKYTLLTTSNFSREFVIDTVSQIFEEIESGVKHQNLSGNCSNRTFEYLVDFTTMLESEFHSWAQAKLE